VFLNGQKVLRARVFSWKEFLEVMRSARNKDWLSILKMAMEMFNGDAKGFACLPDSKEQREEELQEYMRELIFKTISLEIEKNLKNVHIELAPESLLESCQIVMKVSIEFCLNIGATDILFQKIFPMFTRYGPKISQTFIKNLQPFIMSGLFRKVAIPEEIFLEFIRQYDDGSQHPKNLEKIIMQLEIDKYSEKTKVALLPICKRNCLIQALQVIEGRRNAAIQTTYDVYQRLCKQTEGLAQEYDVNDVLQIRDLDLETKFLVEKSPVYIGYKLMLLMKLFLEGRKFPYGNLAAVDWQTYTRQIAALCTAHNFVSALLRLDAACLFKVLLPLFSSMSYVHLRNQIIEGQHEYTPESVLAAIKEVVHTLTKSSGVRADLNKSYDRFCLEVVIGHADFVKEQALRQQKIDHVKFDSGRVYEATLGVLEDIAAMLETDEEELYFKVYEDVTKLINQVYRVKFTAFEDTQLTALQDALERLQLKDRFFDLQVTLFERLEQYVDCFNLLMRDRHSDVFSWLGEKLGLLTKSERGAAPNRTDMSRAAALKVAIGESIKELIERDVDEAMKLIEQWFDSDAYCEELIMHELSEYPDQRFKFLKNYIDNNESVIELACKGAEMTSERKEEADKYHVYLTIYLQLLCTVLSETTQSLRVEDDGAGTQVTWRTLEEFVHRPYLRIDRCLDICQRAHADRGTAILLAR
jgi:hypothetical protein